MSLTIAATTLAFSASIHTFLPSAVAQLLPIEQRASPMPFDHCCAVSKTIRTGPLRDVHPRRRHWGKDARAPWQDETCARC